MQIVMDHPQLESHRSGVVCQEWATEQVKPSQKLDFHSGILGNWKIIWQCWP